MCKILKLAGNSFQIEEVYKKLLERMNTNTNIYGATPICKAEELSCSPSMLSAPYYKTLDIKYPPSLFILYPSRAFMMGKNFTKIPELTLERIEGKYFLHDMDSLITVLEDGNLPDPQFPNVTKIYNDQNKGAKIRILSSKFTNSRFCKGLIAYNHWYYKIREQEWELYTQRYTQTKTTIDSDENNTNNNKEDNLFYLLYISGSRFENLNILNKRIRVKKLEKLNTGDVINLSYNAKLTTSTIHYDIYKFLHKGTVLNLQGFPGPVYILDSVIE